MQLCWKIQRALLIRCRVIPWNIKCVRKNFMKFLYIFENYFQKLISLKWAIMKIWGPDSLYIYWWNNEPDNSHLGKYQHFWTLVKLTSKLSNIGQVIVPVLCVVVFCLCIFFFGKKYSQLENLYSVNATTTDECGLCLCNFLPHLLNCQRITGPYLVLMQWIWGHSERINFTWNYIYLIRRWI